MSQARGIKTRLLLDHESTYGQNPGAPAAIGPMTFNNFKLTPKRDIFTSKAITGNTNPTEPFYGNLDVRGSLQVPVDANEFGHWLRAMFGTELSAVGGTQAAVSVTADAGTDKITLNGHGLANGQGVTFGGTSVPGGLTAGVTYYVRDSATNDFKVAISPGASAINLTSAGTAVTVTAVNAHVWKTGTDMPSLVLDSGATDIADYWRYNGVKIASLALAFAANNDELTADIELIGSDFATSGSAYSANPTSPGVAARFNTFQAVIQEGGAAFAKALNTSLNINFGLDDSIYTIGGGGKRAELPQGLTDVNGSIKILYDGPASLLQKAIDTTESSLKITLTSGTNVLEILIPEVKYSVNGSPIDGPAGRLLDLDWRGYRADSAQDAAVQFTLTNSRATAY